MLTYYKMKLLCKQLCKKYNFCCSCIMLQTTESIFWYYSQVNYIFMKSAAAFQVNTLFKLKYDFCFCFHFTYLKPRKRLEIAVPFSFFNILRVQDYSHGYGLKKCGALLVCYYSKGQDVINSILGYGPSRIEF